MGLRDAIARALGGGFAALGDLAVPATFLSHASTAVDTETGVKTDSYVSVQVADVVLTGYRTREIDSERVRADDRKALVRAAAIAGLTPGTRDRLVADGTMWNVVSVARDPAGALWTLQVRRP